MRLSQQEDVPDVRFHSNLRQLLRQLPYPKGHVRYLLLRQQSRVLRQLCVRVGVFVHEPLLRKTFVRRIVVVHLDAIVLFEQRVDDARGRAAAVLGAAHLGVGRRRERGFATVGDVSLEDDLRGPSADEKRWESGRRAYFKSLVVAVHAIETSSVVVCRLALREHVSLIASANKRVAMTCGNAAIPRLRPSDPAPNDQIVAKPCC
jgi:hypothetical protein